MRSVRKRYARRNAFEHLVTPHIGLPQRGRRPGEFHLIGRIHSGLVVARRCRRLELDLRDALAVRVASGIGTRCSDTAAHPRL